MYPSLTLPSTSRCLSCCSCCPILCLPPAVICGLLQQYGSVSQFRDLFRAEAVFPRFFGLHPVSAISLSSLLTFPSCTQRVPRLTPADLSPRPQSQPPLLPTFCRMILSCRARRQPRVLSLEFTHSKTKGMNDVILGGRLFSRLYHLAAVIFSPADSLNFINYFILCYHFLLPASISFFLEVDATRFCECNMIRLPFRKLQPGSCFGPKWYRTLTRNEEVGEVGVGVNNTIRLPAGRHSCSV